MLDSKLLKPRRGTNKCKLFIKGDWNDGDDITENTSWSMEEIKDTLPYFCILIDLFEFDNSYRHKAHDYNIDIRNDIYKALDFYIDYKKGFYQELLKMKNDKEIFSDRLLALDEDTFKDVYGAVIQDIKDSLIDRCYALPSYDGFGIHSITEIYIDYKGNKYDVKAGNTLKAFAELMDREYDNFASASEDE